MHISEQASVNGLILAAGLSSRMGDFKPLLPFGTKTVIEAAIDSMLAAGISRVVVVLGFCGSKIEAVLKNQYGSEVCYAWNHRYADTDMLESIKCGLQKMPECQSFFLLPGDMPTVKKSTFDTLLASRPDTQPFLLFPSLEGRQKHPPLIHASFIPAILGYNGAGGLRQLWTQYPEYIRNIPVDDPGVWIDLDTRQEYEHCISHHLPAECEIRTHKKEVILYGIH